jgi:hypothetical protein
MLVINLFGGPGSGKSTLQAGLFYEMRRQGLNVEHVSEFAKDLVWEERYNAFTDQLYIVANHHRKLHLLDGKVDYVIMDSPILLTNLYMYQDPRPYVHKLHDMVVDIHFMYNNFNIFLNRKHSYVELGRNQTETEADIISKNTRQLLEDVKDNFVVYDSVSTRPSDILKYIAI